MAKDLDLPILEEMRDVPGLFDRVSSSRLAIDGVEFEPTYMAILEAAEDTDTYFYCLGTLLKARLKYERILQGQPVPSIEQLAPRALLQFGLLEPTALASFLFWRKWIYDIDNRAAQETGYLFEPILAQAIGGVPFSSSRSPVRRTTNGKGRQVDCVVESPEGPRAYELKLRVTIAASGQGRWAEELSFPNDCRASGFKPVLVVFDSTPNVKLEELQRVFAAAGGTSYVGSDAWAHLEQEAGPVMSEFLERYVRLPMESLMDRVEDNLPPITFAMDGGNLIVSLDDDQLIVTRVAIDDAIDDATDPLPDDVDESVGGA